MIIVQVESWLLLLGKHAIRIFNQRILYQYKNHITLKLVRSTIQICNQPLSTPSVPILYCSLRVHHQIFLKVCMCACLPSFDCWLAELSTILYVGLVSCTSIYTG